LVLADDPALAHARVLRFERTPAVAQVLALLDAGP
jgi:hypothetical protein